MTTISERAMQTKVPRKYRKRRSKKGEFFVNGRRFEDRAMAGRYEQLLRKEARGEITMLQVQPVETVNVRATGVVGGLFSYVPDFAYRELSERDPFGLKVYEALVGKVEFEGRATNSLRVAFEQLMGVKVRLVNRNGLDLSENTRKRARGLYARKSAEAKRQVAAEKRAAWASGT
ncbi:MAG: hypothetical protein JJ868_19505 [Shimia sp.]|uniref:hypothetical protein n=1 Tax=Shimia sp. TaxID=1954381 RepID=UPI001B103461|nr:hypothetical protein [Shimia sp.]MBO6899551.1 hypothetical protein [Shimia sp.]